MQALVIGGSGPTGPFIVNGLLARGYQVAVLHRGFHEVEFDRPVEHLHADPHFPEPVKEALGDRRFDVVIATYGRIRYISDMLAGRTDHLLTCSGAPAYAGWLDPAHAPKGRLKIPVREDDPLLRDPNVHKMSAAVVATEDRILEHDKKGDYRATIFRYPNIYGPRMLSPREWCIIRRVRDGRKFMVLPFGGLTFHERSYAENAAHAFMLAVEKPSIAGGQVYNIAEERMYCLRDWAEMTLHILGASLEFLDLPWDWAEAGKPYVRHWHHKVMDSTRIRQQLGYKETVPVEEAMRRTVQWYMQHPLKPGGEEEKTLQDAFDYEAEDQVYQICKETGARLAEAYRARFAWFHTYEHPKEAGEKRYKEGPARGAGAPPS